MWHAPQAWSNSARPAEAAAGPWPLPPRADAAPHGHAATPPAAREQPSGHAEQRTRRIGSRRCSRSPRAARTSRARRGTLHLAHGDVQTPAFVPLATRGAVKTLEPRDVAALGYEMVLGNTFHLFLAPGHELVAELGGLHEFMRWDGPIITDSGGFQVFSMGHGGVADEIKGRPGSPAAAAARGTPTGRSWPSRRRGCAFAPTWTAGERFMGPETSMAVQAALGSDIALVFDECTPFHVTRDYTARSMERTHRWLERCLDWHERHGPAGPGRLRDRPGRRRARPADGLRPARSPPAAATGSRSAARWGRTRRRCTRWWTGRRPSSTASRPTGPATCSASARSTTSSPACAQGIDTFDCAMPTRLGRHGVALVPDPAGRWRVDLVKGRWQRSTRADPGGLPVPGVLGRVLPRLPALPAARARAHRACGW